MVDSNNTSCPNCGKDYIKEFSYCPHCGQANKKLNLSFNFVISEFLLANFNVDSKLITTLKLLLFKPAKLTHEFLDGKRTKYISPIRLYLLISLIYFFILSFSVDSESDIVDFNDNEEQEALTGTEKSTTIDFSTIQDNDSVDLVTESSIEMLFKEKLKLLNTKSGRKVFWDTFRKNISTGMFLLMPLTAFILLLLFYKGSYYFEHLILVIHLQSVWFIVFTLFNLIQLLTKKTFTSFEFLLLIFVTIFWIKRFYSLSKRKAVWKTFLFLSAFSFLLLLFFVSVLALSVVFM
jgi:hypothetical protein